MFFAAIAAILGLAACLMVPGFARWTMRLAVVLLCLCVAAYALMLTYDHAQKRRAWSLIVDLPGQFDIDAPLYSGRNAPHDRLRAFPDYHACAAAKRQTYETLVRVYKPRDIELRCTQQ